MSREHTPRPGATWQRQVVHREVIVPDGPWDGLPVRVTPWGLDEPAPRPNRAARRAASRANRKADR